MNHLTFLNIGKSASIMDINQEKKNTDTYEVQMMSAMKELVCEYVYTTLTNSKIFNYRM